MAKKVVYVMPRPTPSGVEWIVRTAGAKKAIKVFDKQPEAIEKGREIAMRRGTELWVARNDGTWKSKDSFGPNGFPPQGNNKS